MDTIKLVPHDGMWLYNGEIFSDEVTTLVSRANEWREVTEAEKMTLEAELEKQQESEADYEGE